MKDCLRPASGLHHMNYILIFQRGLYRGLYRVALFKGNTRRLDYSSYDGRRRSGGPL